MKEFLDSNLKYPEKALENKIEGTVELEYFVNGNGKITKVNVLKGIGFGCDEEARRLVKSLVYEKAYNKGITTSTRKTIKIHFRLPKKKGLNLNYQLVKSKPKQSTPPKKGETYQITINIGKK